jgi:predicted metal-dependent enzyme (double-stranded beta helix superfamily)
LEALMSLGTAERTGLVPLLEAVRRGLCAAPTWPALGDALVAGLRDTLPRAADVLTLEERQGNPDKAGSFPLWVEPDGTFSVVAFVARPGQGTGIHDHIAWCVLGIVQGIEDEELFALEPGNHALVSTERRRNRVGDVSAFAPPGDIHRVSAAGPGPAISLHVYGADLSRVGSSVRRYYDQPVIAGRLTPIVRRGHLS